MTERYDRPLGDISALSNELEYFLQGVQADIVIENVQSGLELTHEVNRENIVELMISMAPNVHELNSRAVVGIDELNIAVSAVGGKMYGGSSLFQETAGLEPAWYRSTSLSERLARGFLNIGSQQLVIGVAREGEGETAGEEFGMQLYNFLRQLTPIILALSATSPYQYRNGDVVDTGAQSSRPEHYRKMSSRLPSVMFETPPLRSLEDYQEHLQSVSDQVNDRLARGELDANTIELYRDRGGYHHAPFTTLAPHQIYSWVRIRTDHANENSVFSLELRVADISNRIETILALNTFISGLAYYASRSGFEKLQNTIVCLNLSETEIQKTILQVARTGLDTNIFHNGRRHLLREVIVPLCRLAKEGLDHRNIPTIEMEREISRILEKGNGSTQVKRFVEQNQPSPSEMENFLIFLLTYSLSTYKAKI